MVLGITGTNLMGTAMKIWTTYDISQPEKMQQEFVKAVSMLALGNAAYHLVKGNTTQTGLNLASSIGLHMCVDAFKHQTLDEKIIAVTTHINALETLQEKQEKLIQDKNQQLIDLGTKLEDFGKLNTEGRQLLEDQRTVLVEQRKQAEILQQSITQHIQDLKHVRDELIATQAEIKQQKAEAKAEIQQWKDEAKAEIQQQKAKDEAEIQQQKDDLKQQKARLDKQWGVFETQQTTLLSPKRSGSTSQVDKHTSHRTKHRSSDPKLALQGGIKEGNG